MRWAPPRSATASPTTSTRSAEQAAQTGSRGYADAEDAELARTEDFKAFAYQVALHVAATAPLYVSSEEIPEEERQAEMRVFEEKARQEGKPENMIEKIAMGKLNKFYNEYTLLNQQFVKDDTKTIRQYLDSVDKGLKVVAFKRVKLG